MDDTFEKSEVELKSKKSNKKKKKKLEEDSDGSIKNSLELDQVNGTYNCLSNDESYPNLMSSQEKMEISDPEVVKSKKKKKHKEKLDITNIDTVDNAIFDDMSFNNMLEEDKGYSIVKKEKRRRKGNHL